MIRSSINSNTRKDYVHHGQCRQTGTDCRTNSRNRTLGHKETGVDTRGGWEGEA